MSLRRELDKAMTPVPRLRRYGPRVITQKNIGKNFAKDVTEGKPHQGKREQERRRRALIKRKAREAARGSDDA